MSQPDAPDALSSQAKTEPGELLHRLPRRTTPTWEIELLISGAFAFASFQLPGAIDALMDRTITQAGSEAMRWISMAYTFSKVSAYVLITTFLVHLLLRGLWTAAVGLNSVFPAGILWEKLKIGPQLRRVYAERLISLPRTAERIDDAASLVFAVGSLLLIMMVLSGVFLVLVMLVTQVTGAIPALAPYREPVGMTLALVIALLPAVATFLDRRFGGSWPDESRRARATRAVLRTGHRMIGGDFVAPFLLTLTSRVGSARGTMGLIGLIYLAMGVVVVEKIYERKQAPWSGVADLPHSGPLVHDSDHYAGERSAASRNLLVPYLATSVATGDWLDLFVPYHPNRMAPFVARRCPEAALPIKPSDADGDVTDGDGFVDAPRNAAADVSDAADPAAAGRVDPFQALDRKVRAAEAQTAAKAAAAARDRRAGVGATAKLDAERIRRSVLIVCLSGITSARLDGDLLPAADFRLVEDPATGLYGLRYRIATYDLTRGSHVVSLDWPEKVEDDAELPELEPIEIEFWR